MSEWISVYNKKPSLEEPILCLLKDGSCQVLVYEGNYTFTPDIPYDPAWMDYNILSPVTHWMPLPELPHE